MIFFPYAVEPKPGSDIIEDRHCRKRVRFLKYHADPAPEIDRIIIKNIFPVEQYGSVHRSSRNFMHAVETAEKCRFPASGRTDYCSCFILRDREGNYLQGLRFSEECIEVLGFDLVYILDHRRYKRRHLYVGRHEYFLSYVFLHSGHA